MREIIKIIDKSLRKFIQLINVWLEVYGSCIGLPVTYDPRIGEKVTFSNFPKQGSNQK